MLCVNVRYVCALHACLVPEVRKGIRSTGPGVIDDCGLPCGCWVSNLVLCKSNTYFSRLSICPAHWKANLNSFSHFLLCWLNSSSWYVRCLKYFFLSKAPFFSCLIQELTPMLGKQEDATCELCVSSRETMTMTKHIQ